METHWELQIGPLKIFIPNSIKYEEVFSHCSEDCIERENGELSILINIRTRPEE